MYSPVRELLDTSKQAKLSVAAAAAAFVGSCLTLSCSIMSTYANSATQCALITHGALSVVPVCCTFKDVDIM